MFTDFVRLGALANIFLHYLLKILTDLLNAQTFSREHCDNRQIAKVFFHKRFPTYGTWLHGFNWLHYMVTWLCLFLWYIYQGQLYTAITTCCRCQQMILRYVIDVHC